MPECMTYFMACKIGNPGVPQVSGIHIEESNLNKGNYYEISGISF